MSNAVILLGLVLQYMDKLVAIKSLLSKAAAEGRDVSEAELDALFADDDKARTDLQAAIDAARAAGR